MTHRLNLVQQEIVFHFKPPGIYAGFPDDLGGQYDTCSGEGCGLEYGAGKGAQTDLTHNARQIIQPLDPGLDQIPFPSETVPQVPLWGMPIESIISAIPWLTSRLEGL